MGCSFIIPQLRSNCNKKGIGCRRFLTAADFYPQISGSNSRSSAGDLTGTQATGANGDGLVSTVHDCLDLANVGLPGAIGFTVGVRYILTVDNTLSADTAFCHDLTPP